MLFIFIVEFNSLSEMIYFRGVSLFNNDFDDIFA